MSNQQEGGSKIDDGNVGSPQSRNVASLDHLYGLEEEQRQQKQHDFYGSTMHKKKKATTSPRRSCGSVHEQKKDEDSAAPNELDRKLPAAATVLAPAATARVRELKQFSDRSSSDEVGDEEDVNYIPKLHLNNSQSGDPRIPREDEPFSSSATTTRTAPSNTIGRHHYQLKDPPVAKSELDKKLPAGRLTSPFSSSAATRAAPPNTIGRHHNRLKDPPVAKSELDMKLPAGPRREGQLDHSSDRSSCSREVWEEDCVNLTAKERRQLNSSSSDPRIPSASCSVSRPVATSAPSTTTICHQQQLEDPPLAIARSSKNIKKNLPSKKLPPKHSAVARPPPPNNTNSKKKTREKQRSPLYDDNAHDADAPGAYAVFGEAGERQQRQLHTSSKVRSSKRKKKWSVTKKGVNAPPTDDGILIVKEYSSEPPVERDSTVVALANFNIDERGEGGDGANRYKTKILVGFVAGVFVVVAVATGITVALSANSRTSSSSSTSSTKGSVSVTLFGQVYESATTTVVNLSNQEGGSTEPRLVDGTIPTEIGFLTRLTHLDLSFNNDNLKGQIPSEVGTLTGLLQLSLENNSLDGLICSEIGLLTQLTSLSLRYNSLSGTLPSEIGQLKSLEELYLESNMLSGSIPSAAFTRLSSLTTLSLFRNGLSGSLPSALCPHVNPRIDCTEIWCTCCMGSDHIYTRCKSSA